VEGRELCRIAYASRLTFRELRPAKSRTGGQLAQDFRCVGAINSALIHFVIEALIAAEPGPNQEGASTFLDWQTVLRHFWATTGRPRPKVQGSEPTPAGESGSPHSSLDLPVDRDQPCRRPLTKPREWLSPIFIIGFNIVRGSAPFSLLAFRLEE
jgi:hypothetical protein